MADSPEVWIRGLEPRAGWNHSEQLDSPLRRAQACHWQRPVGRVTGGRQESRLVCPSPEVGQAVGLTRLVEVVEARQMRLGAVVMREVASVEVATPRRAAERPEDTAVQVVAALAGRLEGQVVGSMGILPGDRLGAPQVGRPVGTLAGLQVGPVAVVALTDQEAQEGQEATPAGQAEVARAEVALVTQEAAALEGKAMDGRWEAPAEIGGPRTLRWTG